MSRKKYQIGDVFLLPFEDGRLGVGRVLKKDEGTIYVELYNIKPLNNRSEIESIDIQKEQTFLTVWCYDEGLRKGHWEIVSHNPVEHEIVMPEFWTRSSDGEYYLIPGTDTHAGDWDRKREVQKEKIGDAPPYGIGGFLYVERLYAKRLQKKNMF